MTTHCKATSMFNVDHNRSGFTYFTPLPSQDDIYIKPTYNDTSELYKLRRK